MIERERSEHHIVSTRCKETMRRLPLALYTTAIHLTFLDWLISDMRRFRICEATASPRPSDLTDFIEPSMEEVAAIRSCVAAVQFFCLDFRF